VNYRRLRRRDLQKVILRGPDIDFSEVMSHRGAVKMQQVADPLSV
jgi:hypothetical protein